MKFGFGLTLAAASLSFAAERVIFDDRVGGSVRDVGIVVNAQTFQHNSLLARLRTFATEHRQFGLARLTLANDEGVLLRGVGVDGGDYCIVSSFSEPELKFAQVYVLGGSAFARWRINGEPRSIQLLGHSDPFELNVDGVSVRLESFRVDKDSPAYGKNSMSLFLRPIILPSPLVGGRIARQLKEAIKLSSGTALLRVDGGFVCEGGPTSDYFVGTPIPYSKEGSDSAPYLVCSLAGIPTCQQRSRNQDNAEHLKEYERQKAEFVKENDRVKKLNRSQ